MYLFAGKQYVGEPIQCMTPTTFTEDQADYLHSKCWAEDTYYIVQDDDVDGDKVSRSYEGSGINRS